MCVECSTVPSGCLTDMMAAAGRRFSMCPVARNGAMWPLHPLSGAAVLLASGSGAASTAEEALSWGEVVMIGGGACKLLAMCCFGKTFFLFMQLQNVSEEAQDVHTSIESTGSPDLQAVRVRAASFWASVSAAHFPFVPPIWLAKVAVSLWPANFILQWEPSCPPSP